MAAPTWLEGYFTPYVAPAGTGFFHATNGKVDDTARLVTDADVAPGAGISGAKINPVFSGAGLAIIPGNENGSVNIQNLRTGALNIGYPAPRPITDPEVQAGSVVIQGQSALGPNSTGGHIRLTAGSCLDDGFGEGGSVFLSAGRGIDSNGFIRVQGPIVGDDASGDPLSFGVYIVLLTGGKTILRSFEYCNQLIVLQGTLTSNAEIALPLGLYTKIVKNETKGAFTVTARTMNDGFPGVQIPQNAGRWVYCDGSQISLAA